MSVFVLGSGAVQAIEYGGIGGRPAFPRADNPRTDSIFIHTLEPGTVQEDGVLVVNNSAETKTLLVFAADQIPSSSGGFACKQRADEQTGVGTWITLEQNEITLESGTSEVVPFTIAVPESAGVGEHDGCILVQEKIDNTAGSGLRLSFRTGLRVAITVPGEIVRELQILDFNLEKRPSGNIVFKPQVRNLGNVSIDADVKVQTNHVLGYSLPELGGQFPILRDDVSDWNFELEKPFWGGWYRASFAVEFDQSNEASVGVRTGGELTRLEGPTIWFFSSPKLPALLVELAVLAVIVFLIVYSRRRSRLRRAIAEQWVEHEVRPGEDIKSLAEQSGLHWKVLAEANRLEPPYALQPGDKIKLPPRADAE